MRFLLSLSFLTSLFTGCIGGVDTDPPEKPRQSLPNPRTASEQTPPAGAPSGSQGSHNANTEAPSPETTSPKPSEESEKPLPQPQQEDSQASQPPQTNAPSSQPPQETSPSLPPQTSPPQTKPKPQYSDASVLSADFNTQIQALSEAGKLGLDPEKVEKLKKDYAQLENLIKRQNKLNTTLPLSLQNPPPHTTFYQVLKDSTTWAFQFYYLPAAQSLEKAFRASVDYFNKHRQYREVIRTWLKEQAKPKDSTEDPKQKQTIYYVEDFDSTLTEWLFSTSNNHASGTLSDYLSDYRKRGIKGFSQDTYFTFFFFKQLLPQTFWLEQTATGNHPQVYRFWEALTKIKEGVSGIDEPTQKFLTELITFFQKLDQLFYPAPSQKSSDPWVLKVLDSQPSSDTKNLSVSSRFHFITYKITPNEWDPPPQTKFSHYLQMKENPDFEQNDIDPEKILGRFALEPEHHFLDRLEELKKDSKMPWTREAWEAKAKDSETLGALLKSAKNLEALSHQPIPTK